MNRDTKQAVGIASVALGIIYLLLFLPSFDGYGYQGHGGSSGRASIWYWGGVDSFHERSNRGLGVMGGGPESGK